MLGAHVISTLTSCIRPLAQFQNSSSTGAILIRRMLITTWVCTSGISVQGIALDASHATTMGAGQAPAPVHRHPQLQIAILTICAVKIVQAI